MASNSAREGSFILGGQAGSVYSMAHRDSTRNGRSNRKGECTGPRFTVIISGIHTIYSNGPALGAPKKN